MFRRLREDVRAMRKRDPAAKGWLEVLCCYPGLHAVWAHRLAHRCWNGGGAGRPFARLCSHIVRLLTGVEIHPAAEIGRRVTIDHGMGVVIGETAEIGDDVHMYHGVTLGGDTNEPIKRHPTVEDGVQIGANATLLGDITIGERAAVGAGSVVTRDVESGVTVAGSPAERVD
ncbi:serine O-acetyltransferase [Natrinema halophilum]|uniref:serine O-acetyltransferase n=1 Tax=Natrinema halophilum TaxID=1699371 RepID=A0A7D5GU24_9EURY|nr:serine O-acetyltransferase [Natrinema halophilum]QLG49746.1 serine O-acetyltransferase [Natrinema halophilum]